MFRRKLGISLMRKGIRIVCSGVFVVLATGSSGTDMMFLLADYKHHKHLKHHKIDFMIMRRRIKSIQKTQKVLVQNKSKNLCLSFTPGCSPWILDTSYSQSHFLLLALSYSLPQTPILHST